MIADYRLNAIFCNKFLSVGGNFLTIAAQSHCYGVMSRISRSALLPFTVEQVFALVNDIQCYPQFMEGCVEAVIHSADAQCIEATLTLAKGGIKQSFTTRNHLRAPESMVMELVEGPFNHFEGQWTFVDLQGHACKVSLELDFTVANKVVGMAATKLFDSASNNLVDALVKRAKQVYG